VECYGDSEGETTCFVSNGGDFRRTAFTSIFLAVALTCTTSTRLSDAPQGADLTISVIIAAFNAERTIGETLASVMKQTLPPLEILVVDDCSTDGTRDVVRSIPGVTLIEQSANAGPAAARNVGVAASHGELIAFTDADDLWYPDHLEQSAAALQRWPQCGVAFSANDRFGRKQDTQYPEFPPDEPLSYRDALLHGNTIHLLTVVMRRDAFDAAGGFDAAMRYSEDYDLWLRCSLRTKAVYTGALTASYRIHTGQLNQNLPQMFDYTWRARLKLLDEVGRDQPELHEDLRTTLGQIWANKMYTAWAVRSRESLDILLAMAQHFPQQRAAERRWRRRRAYWPVLLLIDRVSKLAPPAVRAALRPGRLRPTSAKPSI
jgi:glycosyltransferase involved in cell wall biosynthesis